MFNKRHYEAVALAMQELCPEIPKDNEGNYDDTGYETGEEVVGRQTMWDDMCEELANMFGRDNPRFQYDRFMAACQPRANVKLRTRYTVVRRSP